MADVSLGPTKRTTQCLNGDAIHFSRGPVTTHNPKNSGFQHPKACSPANLRCSLYADGPTIFANTYAVELSLLQNVLHSFRNVSGLKINMGKTELHAK